MHETGLQMFGSKGLLYRTIQYILPGAVKVTQPKFQKRLKSRRAVSVVIPKMSAYGRISIGDSRGNNL